MTSVRAAACDFPILETCFKATFVCFSRKAVSQFGTASRVIFWNAMESCANSWNSGICVMRDW